MMTDRKLHITVLSVCSALAVVCLHTSTFWTFTRSLGWIASNAVESFFYFAVPIFLMISGATLMDYRERYTTAEYMKKRCAKTVIPFLFWSVFSIFFEIGMNPSLAANLTVLDALNSIVTCRFSSTYYFFFVLYGVYLSIPVLSLIPKESRQKSFLYIMVVGFVVNSLIPFVSVITNGKIAHHGSLSFFVCSGCLIYPIIGYYLNTYSLSFKAKVAVFVLGFAGLVASFAGTWILSWESGEIVRDYKGYSSVPCILYSSAVFLLFKTIPFWRFPQWALKPIRFFSGQTFGIYLIHIFLYRLIGRMFDYSVLNPLMRLGYAVVLFVLAGLIIKLLQKIPLVRRIVP